MIDFDTIYRQRPDKREVGSSGYSNFRNLYDICTRLQPDLVIESGHWKSNSAFLFHYFCGVISHDIQFRTAKYSHPNIERVQEDISNYEYCFVVPDKTLYFFDDHISQKDRLYYLINQQARYAVFDDNHSAEEIKELNLKNPASPTLQELYDTDHPITEMVTKYEVLPFHGGKKDTRLTYIELSYENK